MIAVTALSRRALERLRCRPARTHALSPGSTGSFQRPPTRLEQRESIEHDSEALGSAARGRSAQHRSAQGARTRRFAAGAMGLSPAVFAVGLPDPAPAWSSDSS